MENNMNNDQDMDMTTNRSNAGEGMADNEQNMEQAEGAKQQNANMDETGSHREGQYDKQSDKPTMRPGSADTEEAD